MQSGICIKFLTRETEGRVAGFLTENGGFGMPEVEGNGEMGSDLPFFGEIVNVCCGNVSDAPATNIFVKYFEVVHFL